MSEPRILVQREGAILTLTLNRPDKLNAIDGAMLDALDEVLGDIERDREIRAVILSGAGRAFSAGADIKEWTALAPLEFARSWGLRGHALFDRLAALPPPTIAAINGIAFGGGLELALCADIRIATTEVRLGLPEVTIAALPGWGGTQRLPRLVGKARAIELMATGTLMSFEEARAIGLVNQVWGEAELAGRTFRDAALDYARQFTPPGRASRAVGHIKRAVQSGLEMSFSDGLALERELQQRLFESRDAREGIAANLEKRKPSFEGR